MELRMESTHQHFVIHFLQEMIHQFLSTLSLSLSAGIPTAYVLDEHD